jgi:hypothetical protein
VLVTVDYKVGPEGVAGGVTGVGDGKMDVQLIGLDVAADEMGCGYVRAAFVMCSCCGVSDILQSPCKTKVHHI